MKRPKLLCEMRADAERIFLAAVARVNPYVMDVRIMLVRQLPSLS